MSAELRAFRVRCYNTHGFYAVYRLVYGESKAHAVRIANDMGWQPYSRGHEEIGARRIREEEKDG